MVNEFQESHYGKTYGSFKGKMDKENVNEGLTWRELCQVAKDRVKVKDENGEGVVAGVTWGCSAESSMTWMGLLLLLFEERSFFGLRREAGGGTAIFKERSSKRVLDCFFERAWDRPVLRSR